MKNRLIFVAVVIAFIALMQLPWQWLGRANRAMAEDPAPASAGTLVNGLTLSFQSAAGEIVDARDARLIDLFVPAGQPASPLLLAGPFQATWSGILTNTIKDTCQFSAEGRGDLTVILNDKPVLELHGDFAHQPSKPAGAEVELPADAKLHGDLANLANHESQPAVIKKGKNKFSVVYKSPADGDAIVRLMWAPSGKPFQPVSINTKQIKLMHDPADAAIVAHQAVRQGRELVASLRCMACHQGITGSMPEMRQDAPNLLDLKGRVNQTWTAYWISNPKALRPSASMPCLFHDRPASDRQPGDPPTIDQHAGDIAAYLTTPDEPAVPAADGAVTARGARLFAGLGCIGCHVAPNITDSDPALNRVPLKYVRDKFKPDALRDFLKKPETHYAWIRMPNFHLSDAEASAISAWLLNSAKQELMPVKQAFNADNGKKLFETSGCMNCHAVGKSPAISPAATDFAHADFKRGCVASDRSQIQKGVDFGFTAEQVAALGALAAADWKAILQRDPPGEFATRQLAALRCTACHSIDGADSAWSNLDTDITAIEHDLPDRPDNDPEPKGDQSRPPLTWVGEKLRPSWSQAFIAGEIPYKPRTWLFARMPSFASRAFLLSKGMAMTHGLSGMDDVRPPADAALAEIGKSLTSGSGSAFGCVKCHAVADQAALAPFEAEAPNLAHVDGRLRHDFFTKWMMDPAYFLPGTKMTRFANEDGKTALKEVLNGDAAAEFEAIWNYLRAGEKMEPTQ